MIKITATVKNRRIDVAESGTVEVYDNDTLRSILMSALREIVNEVGSNSGNVASQETEKVEISDGKSGFTLNEQFAALAYRIMSDDDTIFQEEIDGMLTMACVFCEKLDIKKVIERFAMERLYLGLGLDSPIGDIDDILYSVREKDKHDFFFWLNWVAMSDWELTQSKCDLLKKIGIAWKLDSYFMVDVLFLVKTKLENQFPNRGEIEIGI